ncbi:MFS transporter [Haladaptatus sp. GCM10025893]|uniref:MFS transporter n=1 Tax=Haladaptatus sp. GCM10025893 TaxID=3252659 RepID=UPI00360867CE
MTHTETHYTPLKLFKNLEFVAIASVNFAQGISFATIIIALALYADIFQISGLIAGLFGTAYAVVRLVLVLPLGKYIDVGDSKRYLLIGLLIQVLVLVGYTNVQSFEHVILLRAIQGGGSIILILTGLSVVGDICPDEQRGLWLGTYSQVTALSSLSGDLVGGFLLFTYGFSTTYVVLTVVTLLTAVAVFMFLPSDPGGHTELSREFGLGALRMLISRKAIQALVMFRFTFSFAKTAIVLFLPIYAHTEFGMSALLIGGILAGGNLLKPFHRGMSVRSPIESANSTCSSLREQFSMLSVSQLSRSQQTQTDCSSRQRFHSGISR